MGRGRTCRFDPGSGGEGAGPCEKSMWAPARPAAARGHHGGAAAAPGAGGGGLHGEESGEREHPKDAGSGAGTDLRGPRWCGIRGIFPQPLRRPAPSPPSPQIPVEVSLGSLRLPWKQVLPSNGQLELRPSR